MILIVGGTFQGKKAFAEKLLNEKREHFTDGTSCAFSDIYPAKVLFISMSTPKNVGAERVCRIWQNSCG